jgi:hypothetical protein
MKKEKYRVLLLSSYCADNEKCTDNQPCPECLQMCNVFLIDSDVIGARSRLGSFEYSANRGEPYLKHQLEQDRQMKKNMGL